MRGAALAPQSLDRMLAFPQPGPGSLIRPCRLSHLLLMYHLCNIHHQYGEEGPGELSMITGDG